jgi:hypothetical protein
MHLDAIAGSRRAGPPHESGAAGPHLCRRRDPVDAALLQQDRTHRGQSRFQHRQELIPGQRLGGPQRDGALHLRVERVIGCQQVTQHDLQHLADRRVLEIEGNVAARPWRVRDGGADRWPARRVDLGDPLRGLRCAERGGRSSGARWRCRR